MSKEISMKSFQLLARHWCELNTVVVGDGYARGDGDGDGDDVAVSKKSQNKRKSATICWQINLTFSKGNLISLSVTATNLIKYIQENIRG